MSPFRSLVMAWRLLQLGKVVEDFRACPLGRTDELAPDDTVAIDHKAFRHAHTAEAKVGTLRTVADAEQVQIVLLQELLVGGIVVVDGNGQYLHLGHGFLQLLQAWKFVEAGGAPGRPEVEDDHMAAKLTEAGTVLRVVHLEVRRGLRNLLGMVAAVAARKGKQRKRKTGNRQSKDVPFAFGHGQGHRRAIGGVAHRMRLQDHLPIIRSEMEDMLSQKTRQRMDVSKNALETQNRPHASLNGMAAFGHEANMASENFDAPALPSQEIALRLDGSAPAGQGARGALRTRSYVEMEADEPVTHELSVLVPARNEERNLQGCLESLLAQSEPGFALGEQWHLFVIDDGSTDGTLALAQRLADSHAGMHVLRAPELQVRRLGFTGKNAALWFGANQPVARTAKWLLFTDADTLHEPGATHRAVVEAERHGLAMLSYSPRQIAANVVQRALLPIIFSELASTYPPKFVSDPSSPIAAANGQFLLVSREAYFGVGGHQAVADRVLEDVALARLLKRRHPIKLRYAPEAVAARMYRTTGEMMAGWTKNLALLLFGNPLFLAASRLLDFVLLVGLPLLPLAMHWLVLWQKAAIGVLWLRVLLRYWTRIRRAHAPFPNVVLSVLALPLFAFLMVRSWQQVAVTKRVHWKGREYPQ